MEPGTLELLREFVNTREYDHDVDQLDTPDRLVRWLREHLLLRTSAPITDADHRRALDFREAVRSLVMANGEGATDPEAVATLNRIAVDVRLAVHLDDRGRTELGGVGPGVDYALGELFAILHRAMIDGSFDRLKACANESCVWLFTDRSKNRSKKWCDMATCGNAANARAYRKRLRDRPGDSRLS